MMATPSSLQDCYFYFYSSCTKGDECPFRHCELALGTETVCSLWREGRCFRSNCKFRHMESRINRSMIPCYWENQPGGCRKPHCVFLHRKLRNCAPVIKDAPGLILPTSDGPKQPDLNETSGAPNNVSLVEKAIENDVAPDPSLAPVPPLVLSFDEGEESDTESVTSTPVKQKSAAARNLGVKASGSIEEKDFGVKTLEQIRMEKIHKESDSYYGAAYTSTPLDAPRLIDQHYPPKTEFLSLPKDSSLDKSLPAPIIEPKLSGVDEETDLRGRLSIRRNTPSNKVNQVKRLLNFKKQNPNQMEVDSNKLDFKIKTLEEIRREKENKQNKSEVAYNNTLAVLPSLEEKKHVNNMTSKKLKINRKPRELYSVPAVLKQDISAPNQTAESTKTYLISNGIKKILPRSSDKPSEIPVLNKNSSGSPGKRKGDDDSCTSASKIIKLVITSNNCEQVNRFNAYSDGTAENQTELFLQHPEIQPPSSAHEVCGPSLHIHSSTSQDKITVSQSSVTNIEMNGVTTSTSLSCSASPPSSQRSAESGEMRDSPVLPTSNKSDNGVRKDNLIDRSISVDDDLDELLGVDDMNMDEMDAAPSDDILLEIEEFLDS